MKTNTTYEQNLSANPSGSESYLGTTIVEDINPGAFKVIDSYQEQEEFGPASLFAEELSSDPILEIGEVCGSEGIFNVTVLDIQGVKYLFGRKVTNAAGYGQPDFGSLVMAQLSPDRNIVLTSEIWRPEGKDILIEDPRAQQSGGGRTTIGVTAVRQSEGNRTYPAIMELESPNQLLSGMFPSLRIIDKFGCGDQTLPIGEIPMGKNTTSLTEAHITYRPDGLNHTLQVLEYGGDDVRHTGFIDFPENIIGASYKIGTTTPPEWLNDREAFFVFHGLDKTIDGQVVDPSIEDSRVIYQYSILTSRLLRQNEGGRLSFSVDNISRRPIITPDTFPALSDGRDVELHPDQRRVTYCCGGIPTRNEANELIRVELILNQGDKRSWHGLVAADQIIASWHRN